MGDKKDQPLIGWVGLTILFIVVLLCILNAIDGLFIDILRGG